VAIIQFPLSAVGPLCESTSTPAAEALSGLCDALLCNYEEALAPPSPGCKDSLTDGRDNTFTWTPDDNTSDVVFYQVYTVCLCGAPNDIASNLYLIIII
jgi:hypothetical protein